MDDPDSIFNQIAEAIIITDLDGVIRYWNQGAAAQFGWEAATAVGQNLQQLTDIQLLEEPSSCPWEYLLLRKMGHFHVKQQHREGEQLLNEWTAVLLHDPAGNAGLIQHTFHPRENSIFPTQSADPGPGQHFHQLIDILPQLISYIDRNLTLHFANFAFSKFFKRTKKEIVGQPLAAILSEEIVAQAMPYIEKAFSGETAAFQETYHFPGGKHRYIVGTLLPDFDTDGDVKGCYSVVNDITQLAETQAELRESEWHLESFFNVIVDMILLTEIDGTIVKCNPRTAEYLGSRQESLIGKNIYDYIPSQVAQQRREQLETVLQTGKAVESIDTRGDKILDSWMYPLRDEQGEIVRLALYSRDVTEKHRVRKALEASEQKYREAVEATTDGLWDWNLNTRAASFSDTYAEILGLTAKELIPIAQTWSSRLHPQDRARAMQGLQDHIQGRTEMYSIEHRLQTADGSWKWVLGRGRVVEWDDDGEPVRMVGTMTDISALKEAMERQRELAQQIVTIQEQERRRVANELHDDAGQALLVLKLALAVLRDDITALDPGLTQKVDKIISQASETAVRIRNLAHDLRPPSLENIGLHATLEGLCQEFATLNRIHIDYTGDPIDKIADQIAITLYRICQEALTNIVRHASARRVRVFLSKNQNTVSLIISDDGDGFRWPIPPEEQAGNGKGLSILQERVLLLQGNLQIETAPGAGTRIQVVIPRM